MKAFLTLAMVLTTEFTMAQDLSGLRAAVENDRVNTVQQWLDEGRATVNTRVPAPGYGGGEVPILVLAAREGSVRVAELLVNRHADPELRTPSDETALMLASFFADDPNGDLSVYPKHEKIVHLLVEKGGALVNSTPGHYSALAYSAFYDHISITRYLLEHGAKTESEASAEGVSPTYTALMFAAKNGLLDMAKLLLESGAQPLVRNSHGLNSIEIAKQNHQNHLLPSLECATNLKPGQKFSDQCE